MSQKYIYQFAQGKADGNCKMNEILGGKGANLAEMCNLDLPIPPGFTISCEVCTLYYQNNFTLPDEIRSQVVDAISEIEQKTKKKFGSLDSPLLFSVRSGSKFSMPGMLDTILNIGLNDKIAENLNSRFIFDSYRRLIQMYGDVVMKVDSYHLEQRLSHYKSERGLLNDNDLTIEDLKEIVRSYKKIIREETKKDFPQDINEQVFSSINAVFNSWHNSRAKEYRRINNIPENIGTAVNIQSMVFGNLNDSSASGVLFTRNPTTGENKIFGEYIQGAQGEDVVAGIRTPQNIDEMQYHLKTAYTELLATSKMLEKHYRDVQDIEFTIEDEKLYILQTRNAKRCANAAVKIAVDMVNAGEISKDEAILRISPKSIEMLLHPKIDQDDSSHQILARGLPASPGAASGIAIFSTEEAVRRSQQGEKVILIKSETNPEDIAGMSAALAIVTTRGGMTSHAAVVARGMGKPCICALSNSSVDHINEHLIINNEIKVRKEDKITVDGSAGRLILGSVNTSHAEFSDEFQTFMNWVDERRKIAVRANAETSEDLTIAKKFGADGIGLCRTEHMFFSKDRINIVRDMIIAENQSKRNETLEKLLVIQTEDFANIFKMMNGKQVTIRLLDPPLHEFLPTDDVSFESFREYSGLSESFINRRIKLLKEHNPMLGHRGCRLAISHPEIYKMQINAIFKAAEQIKGTKPEIMIPFIFNEKELQFVKSMVEEVARDYRVEYSFGTMIELPSAALLADRIANHAEFFSFGTNDLTQTTLGISRDDCSEFLSAYREKKIIDHDPFESIMEENVGELIKLAIKKGRESNPNMKFGICGEHGGDPKSIEFFISAGVDYVSCSPYRIPCAKVAAAQHFIKSEHALLTKQD